MAHELVPIDRIVGEVESTFNQVCSDKGIIFAREAEFAVQAICASDYSMRIARENPQSVRDAVTNIAAIGISLNPAKKQAYLIPRKGGIVLAISYMGLLDLAIQSGSILWGQADIAYATDTFELNGFDQPPTHKRNPFAKERGEIIGVYVVVKTHDGDYLTCTMTADEVWAIRDRSDAWKAYLKDKRTCPWVTDEGEMVKKTVIKRAYKTWPKSDRLDRAVHHLNTEAGEGITFENHDPLEQPKYLGLGTSTHDAQRAKKIRQAAGAALEHFNLGDELGMWGEVCDITEEDEKKALWLALKPFSDCKAAIKRMAEEERTAQAKLDAERAALDEKKAA
jgi:recombination protein RecT